MEMHSRDIPLLLFYCDVILCTTPACFSIIYRCAMVPTLVENSNFLCTCLLTFFVNKIIMTGEPTHTASKEKCAACPSNQLSSEK